MNNRVYGDKIQVDEESIADFFEKRAKKYNEEYPYVSVNYQDNNPSLTFDRDRAEKDRMLPLLNLTKTNSVLDIGCGVGRWADSLHQVVANYHGTDFSASLIEIAQKRFKDVSHIQFQNLKAQDTNALNLSTNKKFDVVIISGLLIYLNDSDAMQLFNNINQCLRDTAKIYIREPIALEDRLTLNKIFSEELSSEYSAIYRTRSELATILTDSILRDGFSIINEGRLFPQKFSNRKETEQHFIILERRA